MKKIAFFIIAILSCSLINAQEIKFSDFMKGEWESNTECIIARDTIISNTTKAWVLENYGFDINIKKFLWFNWYKLSSTNKKTSHSFSREFFSIENIKNTGKLGDKIGRVKFQELVLCVERGCKCDILKNPGKMIYYDVVHYKRYDGVDHMIWIPVDTTLTNDERYLQSVFWYRK